MVNDCPAMVTVPERADAVAFAAMSNVTFDDVVDTEIQLAWDEATQVHVDPVLTVAVNAVAAALTLEETEPTENAQRKVAVVRNGPLTATVAGFALMPFVHPPKE